SCLHTLSSFFVFFRSPLPTPSTHPPSLHDALPICLPPGPTPRPTRPWARVHVPVPGQDGAGGPARGHPDHPAAGGDHQGQRDRPDRKSTRLNSSHVKISYAVFCLKKKKYKTEDKAR